MSADPPSGPVAVRAADRHDVAAIVAMVHALAEYEREPQSCLLTEEQLHTALFGPAPALFGHVAELDGATVGCALWFLTFSTWEGVHGIHLEDLYVHPAARGTGAGRALLATLAGVCVERGYARLEWVVLDWNAPAIGFYRAIGATPVQGWSWFRLDGDALPALRRRAGGDAPEGGGPDGGGPEGGGPDGGGPDGGGPDGGDHEGGDQAS